MMQNEAKATQQEQIHTDHVCLPWIFLRWAFKLSFRLKRRPQSGMSHWKGFSVE